MLSSFFFLLFVFYVPKISSRTIKAIQVSYAAVFGYDTKDICEAIAVSMDKNIGFPFWKH